MLPGEVLAEELASAFNQFEREARLKVECSISDLERRDAERELLFVRVAQELRDKAGLLKDGRDGVDGTNGADGRDGEPGQNGRDADPQEIVALVLPEVHRTIAAISVPRDGVDGKDGRDGKDADPQEIAQRLLPEIERAVAAIPVPRDGKDADPAEIRALVASEVEIRVSELPMAKDGEPGRDGKDAVIPDAPPDVAEQITRALMFAQMPVVSTDAPPVVNIMQAPARKKTITMRKDANGNTYADVVEQETA